MAEDAVWRADISLFVIELAENAIDIWRYGFTEMLNNAIDHSAGKSMFRLAKRQ